MSSVTASPAVSVVPAFLRPSHPAAAASARGYGASSLQAVQKIEQQVLAILMQAQAETQGVARSPDGIPAGSAGKPVLTAPDMGRLVRAASGAASRGASQVTLTPEAALEMLAGQLAELLTRDGEADWRKHVDLIRERLAQRGARGEALSASLKAAEGALDTAHQAAAAAGSSLADAETAVRAAEDRIAELEALLADSPEADVEEIKQSLAAAMALRNAALGARDAAVGVVLETTQGVAEALSRRDGLLDEINRTLPPILQGPQAQTPSRTNDARLGELLAMLQQLISTTNESKLRNDLEFLQATLKAREAENIRRSEEYQEQIEKAERAQKKMGCIGKLIGWIVTVVAVALAPFSGGASLAVAVTMFAIAVADECGAGIMNTLMTPVIDAIMTVVKAVAVAVSRALEAFGVDSAVIAKIKDGVAAVVVAAAIILVVVLGRKAGADVAVKMAASAVSKAISKALPQVVRTAAQAAKGAIDDVAAHMSKATAKVLGSTSEDVGKRMATVMTISHGVQFANQTGQGIGAVVVANMGIDAARVLAEVEKGLADAKVFRDLISVLLDSFTRTNLLVQDMFTLMVDSQEADFAAAQHVTSRIARHA